MKPNDMSAVAVIGGDSKMMAIWHVAAEPIVPASRLCGAWVTDDVHVQRTVVAARRVVLFGAGPNCSLKTLLTHTSGVIDLSATLTAIERRTNELDEIHKTSPTPKGSPRTPIRWPAPCPVPD